ncbi:succinate dehydrogenase assembly factor 4 [Vineibacter terrae]|uniref:succinate dehydrogenase assembly factor 4 n=1 Tax=Vineibacter terrae TaxID=2586908 RepID=UPI0039C971B5
MGNAPPSPLPAAPADGTAETQAGSGKPALPRQPAPANQTQEIGGPPGPEPTRYGDWQFNGRVTDF